MGIDGIDLIATMDTNPKSKKKSQEKINNLPKGIFDRLQFITALEEDLTQVMEPSIFESYAPHVLNSCNTSCKMPADPLDVKAFESITNVPGCTPYFQYPNLPQRIKVGHRKKIFKQSKYPSLIPLLTTAKFSRIDTSLYNLVTKRNSMRKLAMNNEDFVINVVRFGSTLFMRRFARHQTIDKNDVGFRFEEMCTNKGDSKCDYNQLIEGHIGNYKILMMCETDAVDRENGESIELKCQKSDVSKSDENRWWLQAYLSGTKTVIHGRRAKDDQMVINRMKQYKTSSLGDTDKKIEMFNRLHSILNFLFSNVAVGRSYMLRGLKDENTKLRSIRLYEVIDEGDKKKLTFITDKLLQTFSPDK